MLLALPRPVPAATGDLIPLEGPGGAPYEALDLTRGATILVVWASWSPRCRDVGPRIDRLADTWSGTARIASVVFQETPEEVREHLAGGKLRSPVYIDSSGDFSQQHAVTTLPMLLIFRDGELAFRGRLSADPDPVIERVLGSGPASE